MKIKILLVVVCLFLFNACAMPPQDPYHLAEAKDKISRGNYWYNRGCYQEAASFYQEGLDEARLSDNINLIITSLNDLGTAALAENKLNEAASFLEQALNLALSTEAKPQMAYILGNLGSLAYKAKRLKDAENFWLEAINTANEAQQNPARFWCNLARLELDHNRGANLEQLVETGFVLAQKDAEQSVLADAYNLKGLLALKNNNLTEAEEYFNRALVLDRLAENTRGLAQDIESLALLQIEQGKNKEAFASLDRAFFLWAGLGDFNRRDKVFNIIKKMSQEKDFPQKIGQYQEALKNPDDFAVKGRLCP